MACFLKPAFGHLQCESQTERAQGTRNCSNQELSGALSSRKQQRTLPTRCRRVMTDADCFKAVRKLARANAKLLRQQRVLEADLIDAQLTILKQQAQLEAAAIANAGAKDAAQREVAARRELDAERAARAPTTRSRRRSGSTTARRSCGTRRTVGGARTRRRSPRSGGGAATRRIGCGSGRRRAAQVTQLARHRVARATAARASAQARCASSGDDETTFSPSQPDFPEPPDPYIDAPEFFPRRRGSWSRRRRLRGARCRRRTRTRMRGSPPSRTVLGYARRRNTAP